MVNMVIVEVLRLTTKALSLVSSASEPPVGKATPVSCKLAVAQASLYSHLDCIRLLGLSRTPGSRLLLIIHPIYLAIGIRRKMNSSKSQQHILNSRVSNLTLIIQQHKLRLRRRLKRSLRHILSS